MLVLIVVHLKRLNLRVKKGINNIAQTLKLISVISREYNELCFYLFIRLIATTKEVKNTTFKRYENMFTHR